MKTAISGTRQAAEIVAIQALAFIAGDPERLGRFLDVSGIPAEQIRSAAREPGFLAGVLEHMVGDESLLIAFAEHAGFDPAEVARAFGALGGRLEHP